jgi:hypothetical protein
MLDVSIDKACALYLTQQAAARRTQVFSSYALIYSCINPAVFIVCLSTLIVKQTLC